MSQRHHIIITGTGRAGTTFLLQLLMRLELQTGYTEESFEIDVDSRAGSEWDLSRDDAPYIVKSPWLSDTLEEFILRRGLCIDHAIIPVRNLRAAAASRRAVVAEAPAERGPNLPGGLMYTDVAENQEVVLAAKQAKLIEVLAKYEIPHTLLYFPRLAIDSAYLQRKLEEIFGAFETERFHTAFARTSRPELIHEFGEGAAASMEAEAVSPAAAP